MRTTIDLPDDVYRVLKVRAALTATTMRDLTRRLIERGLSEPSMGHQPAAGRRSPPPVIIPARGLPIAAVLRSELRRLEEVEDEARHARSARR